MKQICGMKPLQQFTCEKTLVIQYSTVHVGPLTLSLYSAHCIFQQVDRLSCINCILLHITVPFILKP